MYTSRLLARVLLVLLLFMQFATLAHSTEHHLLNDSGHCAACSLQQHFGQATPADGTRLIPAAPADHGDTKSTVAPPAVILKNFHARAPPVVSLT